MALPCSGLLSLTGWTTLAGVTTLALVSRRLRATLLRLITVQRHANDWWMAGTFSQRTLRTRCADGEQVTFSLMLDPALSSASVSMLEDDLAAVALALPPRALRKAASSCHVWCNRESGQRGACVHWCTKPFQDPSGEIAERPIALEINNFRDYTTSLLNRENVLLHELAHVFNATIGREHRKIVALFERAVEGRRYERVDMIDGSAPQRAYGLSNHLEFFASLSVPLFGGVNDYFPFRRDDLQTFESVAMRHIWSFWGDLAPDSTFAVSSFDAAAIDALIARAALRQSRRGGRQIPRSPPAFLDKCVARLRSDADGGDAAMDAADVPGTAYELLAPSATGFTAWTRDGGARGVAEWVLPSNYAPSCGDRILYIHGGGFQYYSPREKYRALTSRLAAAAAMPVLAIDYRKVPEHACPAAACDALDALRWIGRNHAPGWDEAGSRSSGRIFLVGDSAGGNLVVAALLLMHAEAEAGEALVPVSAAATWSGWFDLSASLPSYTSRAWAHERPATTKTEPALPPHRFADPIFGDGTAESSRSAGAACARRSTSSEDTGVGEDGTMLPIVSPLFADSSLLAQLPPLLVMVGDAEVMRDESVVFAARVEAAKSASKLDGADPEDPEEVAAAKDAAAASVQLIVVPRMWHVFQAYEEGMGVEEDGVSAMVEASAAIAFTADFLKAGGISTIREKG